MNLALGSYRALWLAPAVQAAAPAQALLFAPHRRHDPRMSQLPSPPRAVPTRLWLSRWRPFGAIAAVVVAFLAVLMLTAWQRDGFASPRDDWRLDGDCATAVGLVTEVAVQRSRHGVPDRHALATFRFTDAAGKEHLGARWIVFGAVLAGERCGVEHLMQEPHISRLRGSRMRLFNVWLEGLLGPVLLPLAALLALWGRSCRRLRLALAQGHESQPVLLARGPFAKSRLPWLWRWQRVSVRYACTAADGARIEAVARPLAASALGQIVLTAAEGAPLVGAAALVLDWAPTQPELTAARDLLTTGSLPR